jgi:hypothetical protein
MDLKARLRPKTEETGPTAKQEAMSCLCPLSVRVRSPPVSPIIAELCAGAGCASFSADLCLCGSRDARAGRPRHGVAPCALTGCNVLWKKTQDKRAEVYVRYDVTCFASDPAHPPCSCATTHIRTHAPSIYYYSLEARSTHCLTALTGVLELEF